MKTPATLRLSIVIVNYASWPDSVRLAADLAGSGPVGSGLAEVVVVDNASPGPVPVELSGLGPGVRSILRPDNGGFSAGVNAGWRSTSAPWILVLNPDVVPAPGFVAAVLSRMAAYKGRAEGPPGIVGFALSNEDGSRQPSVGAFPGLARTLREQWIPRHRRKYRPDRKVQGGPVDWVTGACFLARRDLLEAVGGMDEDFFLYHEEVALCRVARSSGWAVEYDPAVSIVHLRPLQNRAISPKMRVITRHSKLLYFRKHRPRWEFRALALGIRAEARVRGAVESLRGHRAEARSWALIDGLAGAMAGGSVIVGAEVRGLAESVDDLEDESEKPRPAIAARQVDAPSPRRPHGRRPTPLRKDGSA